MEEFAVAKIFPAGHNPKVKKNIVGIIRAIDDEDARSKLRNLLEMHGFKVEIEDDKLKLADETLLCIEAAPSIERTYEAWLDSLWESNIH